MKYRICFILILVCHFSLGQNNYSDIVKPKLSFVSDKSEATDISNYVVLGTKDTLFAKYDTYEDFSHLIDTSAIQKKLISGYQYAVFYFGDMDSKKPFIIKQWNCPIVIYLDKKLPKNVQKDFKNFYSQIKEVKNLSISFTNNIEFANYHIKTVDETINTYSNDFEFDSEEEKNNFVFTGATYNLLEDNNGKYFSGTLKVNPKNKSEEQLIRQLKQMFFLTIGNFIINYSPYYENLSSSSYINSEIISNYDLNILKIHYNIIYDDKINRTDFNELIKLSKLKK